MQPPQQQSHIELNQNFGQLCVMRRSTTPGVPSGVEGVTYFTFEQRGDGNYGRMTFIADFEPGASFPQHVHDYGEEVYVIDGILSDQFGDYPKGHYVRQAINSSHTPYTTAGTKLFVKMWQMPLDSKDKVLLNTNAAEKRKIDEGTVTDIFQSHIERVSIFNLAKGSVFHSDEQTDVTEIFIIEGSIKACGVEIEAESWMRIPKDRKYDIEAIEASTIYIKVGKGIIRGKNWEEMTA